MHLLGYGRLAATTVVLIGLAVLTGWCLDLKSLTSFIPGWPSMLANTALMSVLAGTSLWLRIPTSRSRAAVTIGTLCAVATGLVAGLTLAEHALGVSLGIDHILIHPQTAPDLGDPMRPSSNTATAFLLVSAALVLIDHRTPRGRRPAELLALAAGSIASIVLLGYLFGVHALYDVTSLIPHTGMTVHTAVSLLGLSTGILAARPDLGLMSIITAEDMGGIAARRLLLGLLAFLPVASLLVIGGRIGWFAQPLGSAFILFVAVVGGSALVLVTATRLSRLDIKARRAEEARARLASLVESSDDAIIAKTLDGIVLHWNAAAERIYGYSAREMIGQSIFTLVPPERTGEIAGIVEKIRRGEHVQWFETVRLRRDGKPLTMSLTISPIVDAAGRILGASEIARDISEQKAAEEALSKSREAERLLRAELEELARASTVVSEMVADLPRFEVNAVLHTIALQAQALTHAEYVALGVGTDPDKPFEPWIFVGLSQEMADTIGRFPRAVGTLGSVARTGKVIRTRDVHSHEAFRGFPPHHPEMHSFLGVPIRHRGRPVGNLYLANKQGAAEFSEQDERLIWMLAARVAVAIETARLYASEALQRAWLQNIIDQMPEGVVLLDAQGQVMATNQAAVALSSGETGAVDPYGNRVIFDVRGLDECPIALDDLPIVRAFRSGEVTTQQEFLLRQPDGRLVPIAVSAAPVRDENGQIKGATAVIQDISARKELDRLREEWASIVAHDLRQPVATIALSAGRLVKLHLGELPEKERKALERIQAASTRLNRMIDDLLDASRIEAKRLSIECRMVNLSVVIDSVVESLHETTTSYSVRVIAEPEQSVWIDPDRIHQVLGNLIANAAKYGRPGTEIRIEVAGRDDLVEVTITNRGPGIPPAELPLLFSRFSRTRGARASPTPGLGLGLYISKGLVEAHGGRLWAESVPEATTSFHFTVSRHPRSS